MKKRRNHDAGFKARIALEALKGERTVSELTAEYGVVLAWRISNIMDADFCVEAALLHKWSAGCGSPIPHRLILRFQ